MLWQVATCVLLIASAHASCNNNDCSAGEDGNALLQTKASVSMEKPLQEEDNLQEKALLQNEEAGSQEDEEKDEQDKEEEGEEEDHEEEDEEEVDEEEEKDDSDDSDTASSLQFAVEDLQATIATTFVNESGGDMLPEKLSSMMLEVQTNVYDDGARATVSFVHEGRHHRYSLTSHNIFSDNAQVIEGGSRSALPQQTTFRSRDQGQSASMTIHKDGEISGLFEHEGTLLEVQPVAHEDEKVAKALFQVYTGKHPAHLIRTIVLAEVDRDPEVAEENPKGIHNNHIPQGYGRPSPKVHNGKWRGRKWFPGCYRGDKKLHNFIIGVTTDYEAKRKYGNKLASKLTSIVNDASLVYENQFNIRLKVGTWNKGLNYGGCPWESKICDDRLAQTRAFVNKGKIPFYGAVHHFTGCGKSWGTMGLAYVGTICKKGSNTGANKLNGRSPWLTFAHELGHNFNGKHSFERGQGSTGGIMDYGDGKLQGHYQFNTNFRKRAMCRTMNAKVNKCQGKFVRATTRRRRATSRRRRASPKKPKGPTYYYKGSQYWRYNDKKDKVDNGYPRKVNNWRGIPNNIDAVFTWGGNGGTYFYKGDQYWKYNDKKNKVDNGYPKKIRNNWRGIPNNIDAVFTWGGNGGTYFFKGDQYWKYNDKKDKVNNGYPKKIRKNWRGIPNNIDAVFVWSR